MPAVKLDAEEGAAQIAGGQERGPRSAEGIEHKAMRLAEGSDQGFERFSRTGMKPVAIAQDHRPAHDDGEGAVGQLKNPSDKRRAGLRGVTESSDG